MKTFLFYTVNRSSILFSRSLNYFWLSSVIFQFFMFTDTGINDNMSHVTHKNQSIRDSFILYVHPCSREEILSCIPQFLCFQSTHTDPICSKFQLPYDSCNERHFPSLFWRVPKVGSSNIEFCLIFFLNILHWSMLKTPCLYSYIDLSISVDYSLDFIVALYCFICLFHLKSFPFAYWTS